VHPLEIFDAVTVDSELSHPFVVTYTAEVTDRFNELESNTLYESDVSCTDTDWFPLTYGIFNSASTVFQGTEPITDGSYYLIQAGRFVCLDYVANMPGGFNMNYDSATKTAVSSLPLSSGVVCTSCYVYMGAQFEVHVELTIGGTRGMYFYAKMIGGAGVNVRVDATDPRISGVRNFDLIPAARSYDFIPVVSGNFCLLRPLFKFFFLFLRISHFDL
jgi:hypothetical protein